MIGPRPFYLAAALFAAAGAVLRFAPVSAAEGAGASPVAPPAGAEARLRAPADPRSFSPIVASNAFAADRKPPAVRFVPEGLRRDTVPVARAPRKPAEPSARLFGISRGPGGAVALIDADPDVPGAEVYRIGDTVRGGRVTNISETTVTLTRPSGPVILRLPDAGDRR
jgi:hypothetical protein